MKDGFVPKSKEVVCVIFVFALGPESLRDPKHLFATFSKVIKHILVPCLRNRPGQDHFTQRMKGIMQKKTMLDPSRLHL